MNKASKIYLDNRCRFTKRRTKSLTNAGYEVSNKNKFITTLTLKND